MGAGTERARNRLRANRARLIRFRASAGRNDDHGREPFRYGSRTGRPGEAPWLRTGGCAAPEPAPGVPEYRKSLMGWQSFPPYLINFFKYPVVLDGHGFAESYRWQPQHSLSDISTYYRSKKRRRSDSSI